MQNSSYNLGSATDSLKLSDLPASTTVTLGAGSDTVTASGDLGNLTVASSASGTSSLELKDAYGTITFDNTGATADGSVKNSLSIDDSASTLALTGSLAVPTSGPGVQLTLDDSVHTLTTNLDSPINLNSVSVKLEAGNDTFDVNLPGVQNLNGAPSLFQVDGGAGNDTFNLDSAIAETTYDLIGGDGADTVHAAVNAPPTSALFPNVSPSVERLVIDGSKDAQKVAWSVDNSSISASGVSVINSAGADSVTFLGGASGQDTLTVGNPDGTQAVNVVVNGSTVDVSQGVVVLSQTQNVIEAPKEDLKVDGLTDADQVVTTPDGQFVFASGSDGSGVARFRRDPSTGTLGFLGELPVSGGGVSALALSAPGSSLYVAHGSGGSTQIEVFSINSSTGSLSPSYFLSESQSVGQIVISPDGATLLAVGASDASNRQLFMYRWNSSTKHFEPVNSPIPLSSTVGHVSFSNDGSQFFIPDSQGKLSIVTTESGASTTYDTQNDGPNLSTAKQAQVSADGKLLMTYSDADSRFYFYRLPEDLKTGRITRLGSLLENMTGWSSDPSTKAFVYDGASGLLAMIDSSLYAIEVFHWNSATSQFNLVSSDNSTLLEEGLQPRTLDFAFSGAVGASGSAGTIAVRGLYSDGSSLVYRFNLDSSANIISNETLDSALPGTPVQLLYDAKRPQHPLVMAEVTDPSTQVPAIGAWDADGAFHILQDYTAKNTILGFAANRTSSGPLSNFFATYTDAPGYYYLQQLVVSTDGSDKNSPYYTEALTPEQQVVFASNSLVPDKLSVSADGPWLLAADQQGDIALAPIRSNGTVDPGVLGAKSLNLLGIGLEPGFIPTDFAINNGLVYAVTDRGVALASFPISTSSTRLLDPGASPEDVLSGDYDFKGETAVVQSADGNTLYLATNDGSVRSLPVDPSSAELRATTPPLNLSYGTASGSPGTGDTPRIERSGENLIITLPQGNLLSVVSLASGTPSLSQQTVLTDPTDFALAPGAVYATESNGTSSSLAEFGFDGSTLQKSPTSTITQGSSRSLSLSGVEDLSVSPDNKFLYGVAPADHAATVIDLSDESKSRSFFQGVDLSQGLSGHLLVTSMTVSGQSFGIVVSPDEDTATVFAGTATGEQTVDPRFQGATTVASTGLTENTGTIFVANGNGISIWTMYPNSGAIAPGGSIGTGGDDITLMRFANGRLYTYDATLKQLVSYDSTLDSGSRESIALPQITGLAIFDNDVYATSTGSGGRIYHLIDQNGTLSPATDFITDGQGLSGASSVALSADGSELFVASASDDSIAAFSRDPSTGALKFLESLTDGRGASGFHDPTAMGVAGSTLYVASGQGQFGVPGGIARLDVLPLPTAQPFHYNTSFDDGITKLTINGSQSFDTIQQNSLSADSSLTSLTINGEGGGDVVSLNALGAGPTTVNFGDGLNEADVNLSSLSSGAGRTLTVNAQTGLLKANITALGANTTATLNIDKYTAGTDVVNVNGLGIPSSSSLTVNGAVRAGGPVLIDNADGNATTVLAQGTVTGHVQSGHGPVYFNNMETASEGQQVFLLTAPNPSVKTLWTIHEGDSLVLDAKDNSNLSGDTFSWDLNGDGLFTDATGSHVSLTWTQLQALGITSAGSYPISVQVTTTQNTKDILGYTYQAGSVAQATLTVLDTPPSITTPAGTATLGAPFSIPLSATDPGNEPVTAWDVNWGDSSAESFGASATSASHVYTDTGSHTIVITAHQGSIVTSTSGTSITAVPGAGSVSVAQLDPINAGDDVDLSASVLGSPSGYSWTLSDPASGQTRTYSTSAPSLHKTWADLGFVEGGNIEVDLAVTYNVDGSPTIVDASTILQVNDVAPTGTLSASVSGVPQGSADGAVSLSVSAISVPAPVNSSPQYTVAYDFDNDGTLDTGRVSASATEPVSASFLLSPGTYTVRAELQAPNGLTSDLYTTFGVTAVAPTLQLSTPSAADEGSATTLSATVSGVALSVNQWQVQWGDGQTDTAAGDGSLMGTFTHIYANNLPGNAPYTVSVSAETTSGTVTQTTRAAVSDVAPSVSLSTWTPSVDLGRQDAFALAVAVTDPGADVVSGFTVDWGDGQTQTVSGNPETLYHTYTTRSASLIRVTSITNNDGTFWNPSNTVSAAVTDPAPSIIDNITSVPANGAQGVLISMSAGAVSVETGSEPLTFTWTVTDPNGKSVSLTENPDDPRSQLVAPDAPKILAGYQYDVTDTQSFTPTVSGNYSVSLTVSNDSGAPATETWAVSVADVAPTINTFQVPSTGTAGSPINLSASASDPGGPDDPLTYTWTITESATQQTTTLHGTDPSFTPRGGSYQVRLDVEDQSGESDRRIATVLVDNPGPSIADFQVALTADEADPATFAVSATDPAGTDGLTYSWTVIDPRGVVTTLFGASVHYTYHIPGFYSVEATVTDPVGLSASSMTSVAVSDVAPTIDSASVPSSGTEGVALAFSSAASDVGGPYDPLSYLWTVTDQSGNSVTLTGPNPSYVPADNGDYSVSLSVTDSFQKTVTQSIPTTIQVLNQPPALSAINTPAGPTYEGDSVTLTVPDATDVPADLGSITYSWSVTGPDGQPVAFTGSGRFIRFQTSGSGDYLASVTATDKDGGNSTVSATIPALNLAPSITSTTVPSVGFVGNALTFQASALDVPADTPSLVYSWTFTPGSGSPTTLTGKSVSYTPQADGPLSVSLTVTDSAGGSDEFTSSVPVQATPISLAPLVLPSGAVEANAVNLHMVASDALGGSPEIGWTIIGPDQSSYTFSGTDITFTPPDNGTYSVSVTASDAHGEAQTLGSFSVRNLPPTIQQVTLPSAVHTGDLVTLSALATDPAGSADPLTYTWTVSNPDGSPLITLHGADASFTPTQGGQYGISLVVDDGDGGQAKASRALPVIENEARTTSTALTLSAPAVAAGQSLEVSALVTNGMDSLPIPAGAQVRFQIDGKDLGSPVEVSAQGVATVSVSSDSLSLGSHTLTAEFLGAAGFLASSSGPAAFQVLGEGVYAIGTTLFVVGGNTSDYVHISASGSKADGTSGLSVQASLDRAWSSRSFNQPFTDIDIIGYNGNDTIQLSGGLTLSTSVVEGDGRNYVQTADGNDSFTFGAGQNVVFSGNGDKTIVSHDTGRGWSYFSLGNGDHRITAGDGNDGIVVGNGNNVISMGDGNDSVMAGNGDNTITLGNGNDFVLAGNGDNTITLGNGNDTTILGNGDNVVVEGDGRDFVLGGNGADFVIAGRGRHTVILGNGDDVVVDGAATLADSGDSFRSVLNDWKGSSTVAVNTRLNVTKASGQHPNVLLLGSGRDWLFAGQNTISNRKLTD